MEVYVQDANQWRQVSRHGVLSGIEYGTAWGDGAGGCSDASFTIDLLGDFNGPNWLRAGRQVQIYDGPQRVWWGVLAEDVEGRVRTYHAEGLAVLGLDYQALDSTGTPTSKPNTAYTQAVARGLPWQLPASGYLTDTAYSSSDTTVALNTLNALLTAQAEAESKRWGIFADGDYVKAADPTTPLWLVKGIDPMMGVADQEFVTDIYARYVATVAGTPPAPATYGVVHVSNADLIASTGRRKEVALSLIPLGLMTSLTASGLAQARLNRAGQRTGYTNGFTIGSDNLFHINGVRARLSQPRAGDMVRVAGIVDTAGNLATGGTVDIVIGETRHDVGGESLEINPLGMVPRDLESVLAAPTSLPGGPRPGAEVIEFAEAS